MFTGNFIFFSVWYLSFWIVFAEEKHFSGMTAGCNMSIFLLVPADSKAAIYIIYRFLTNIVPFSLPCTHTHTQ